MFIVVAVKKALNQFVAVMKKHIPTYAYSIALPNVRLGAVGKYTLLKIENAFCEYQNQYRVAFVLKTLCKLYLTKNKFSDKKGR